MKTKTEWLDYLGFYLEEEQGVWMVIDQIAQSRTATMVERVLWEALTETDMTKPELIRLMRLLSGMESILLFSGMQHLNQRAHIPDYLLEELTALTKVLEREILK